MEDSEVIWIFEMIWVQYWKVFITVGDVASGIADLGFAAVYGISIYSDRQLAQSFPYMYDHFCFALRKNSKAPISITNR